MGCSVIVSMWWKLSLAWSWLSQEVLMIFAAEDKFYSFGIESPGKCKFDEPLSTEGSPTDQKCENGPFSVLTG